MMNIDFLQEAIQLSIDKMEAGEGGPFGAIIVKDGHLIGRGWNRVTTAYDPTAHAEVEAIRAACKQLGSFSLAGCEIYSSCEPCPMCLSAIYWARLDALYYAASHEDAAEAGFDDAFLYTEIPKPIAERKLSTRQALQGAAKEAFTRWKNKQDRVSY